MALLAPTPYALLADLTASGITSAAIGSVTVPQQQAQVDEANAKVDSYIGAKFQLPLTSWAADLRGAAVAIAAFGLIAFRGFDPEDAGDMVFQRRKDEAIRWLERISKGEVTPVVVDSSPTGKGGAGGNPFTSQARSQIQTSQGTLDGQVTVSGDPQTGLIVVGRPALRGW